MKALFKVADAFTVDDDEQCLILSPEWPLPDCGENPIRDKVSVITPAGETKVFVADVSKKHFTLVKGGSVWNYVVAIPYGKESDVPLGSEIWIEDALEAKLNAKLEAKS
jgi:hypothetical protein